MQYFLSFLAGFLSTFVFHQGALALLYVTGLLPRAPFDLTPTAPLGIPSVVSLAFFGGLWGVIIWHFLTTFLKKRSALISACVLGAIGPTFVAFTVVSPLKNVAINPAMIPVGLFLNFVWGFGLWAFLKLFRKFQR